MSHDTRTITRTGPNCIPMRMPGCYPEELQISNARLTKARRNAEVVRLWDSGEWTQDALAAQFGICQQRVNQLIRRARRNERVNTLQAVDAVGNRGRG